MSGSRIAHDVSPDGPTGSGTSLADATGTTVARAAALALDALERHQPGAPWSGVDTADLVDAIRRLEVCPDDGVPLAQVWDEVGAAVLAHGIRVDHPSTAAHLHCPTLPAAASAELVIGATNQSLDSFDQAPAATHVEDHLVGWLTSLLGLPPGAGGVLTAGGTSSNLLGLFLARERAAARLGLSVRRDGLPPEASSWRIVTSETAHFSVAQAASVLGLGERCVVTVPVDDAQRMDVAALDRVLAGLDGPPLAVVATAGTTDAGAIDPLDAIADRAQACGTWLHVDAAVGSAFVLSDRLAPWLSGIERADSVTADLHKLWWQPIGASTLLVRDAGSFGAVSRHSDYLNRAEDEAAGVLNLVSRSLDTSRRFDALKVLVSLRATGRRTMGALLEACVETAHHAARTIEADPLLELAVPVSTVTVLFRVRGSDETNARVAQDLLASGEALVGRTTVDGRAALKLTIVNPACGPVEVDALLALVRDRARTPEVAR